MKSMKMLFAALLVLVSEQANAGECVVCMSVESSSQSWLIFWLISGTVLIAASNVLIWRNNNGAAGLAAITATFIPFTTGYTVTGIIFPYTTGVLEFVVGLSSLIAAASSLSLACSLSPSSEITWGLEMNKADVILFSGSYLVFMSVLAGVGGYHLLFF